MILHYRKVTSCVCCLLAAVAIGKGGRTSKMLGGLYIANQKNVLFSSTCRTLHWHLCCQSNILDWFMVSHALVCCPPNMAKFSGIGNVGHGYIGLGNRGAYMYMYVLIIRI